MKYVQKLIIRVLSLLIILLIPNIFYTIFTPLTIYPVYFFFQIFQYNPQLTGNLILINKIPMLFVPACIAAAAYGLLTILILLTKNIKFKKIIKMLSLGYFLILTINIIRIIILMLILIHFGPNLFETVHMLFWRIMATLLVVLIWIFLIKKYKIKEIPVYSDLKYLISKSYLKK